MVPDDVGAVGNREKPRSRRDKARRALYCETRQEEMQKTATNGNVYLGRDPEGPLAPEEGQRPYSSVYVSRWVDFRHHTVLVKLARRHL